MLIPKKNIIGIKKRDLVFHVCGKLVDEMRSVDIFGTCKTIFKGSDEVNWILPWIASVIRKPSATVIIWFRGKGLHASYLVGL